MCLILIDSKNELLFNRIIIKNPCTWVLLGGSRAVTSLKLEFEFGIHNRKNGKRRRIDRRTDLQKNHFRGVLTITGIVSRVMIGDADVICGTSSFISSYGIFAFFSFALQFFFCLLLSCHSVLRHANKHLNQIGW